MVALDIGPHVSLTDAKALLVSGEKDGRWSRSDPKPRL
jgi:hypothetical protein